MQLIAGPERQRVQANGHAIKLTERPVLRTHDLQVWQNTTPFDFNLYPGEIVGITGLDGQGQADFVKVLAGVQQPVSGWISIVQNGKAERIIDMQAARKAGISYISGDRKKDGILPNMSIFENMVMPIYPAAVGGWISPLY